jgi:hypothetical protein
MKWAICAIVATMTTFPHMSQASDSVVRGLAVWAEPNTRPAPADGAAEQYVDTLFGSASGPLLQDGSRNMADVVVAGLGGIAVMMQLGDDNNAAMNLQGDNARGMILQDGAQNDGRLHISGSASAGVLEQIGERNAADLVVLSAGTSVLYRQIGNDMGSLEPMSVNSDAGFVQIMVTSYPSYP